MCARVCVHACVGAITPVGSAGKQTHCHTVRPKQRTSAALLWEQKQRTEVAAAGQSQRATNAFLMGLRALDEFNDSIFRMARALVVRPSLIFILCALADLIFDINAEILCRRHAVLCV